MKPECPSHLKAIELDQREPKREKVRIKNREETIEDGMEVRSFELAWIDDSLDLQG